MALPFFMALCTAQCFENDMHFDVSGIIFSAVALLVQPLINQSCFVK